MKSSKEEKVGVSLKGYEISILDKNKARIKHIYSSKKARKTTSKGTTT